MVGFTNTCMGHSALICQRYRNKLATSQACLSCIFQIKSIRKTGFSCEINPPHMYGSTDRVDMAQPVDNTWDSLNKSIPEDLPDIYVEYDHSVLSNHLDEYILIMHVCVIKLSHNQDGVKGLWSNLALNALSCGTLFCHLHWKYLGELCNSGNNHGITVTSLYAINKVIDGVILLKYRVQLHNSNTHLAYNENHQCVQCLWNSIRTTTRLGEVGFTVY